MKRLFVFLATAVFVILFASIVSALQHDSWMFEGKSASIKKIDTKDVVYLDEQVFPIDVSVKNNGIADIKGLRIKAIIPELGISDGTDYFILKEGKAKTKRLFLRLDDAKPGIYHVMILVTDGDVRDVEYREIEIKI